MKKITISFLCVILFLVQTGCNENLNRLQNNQAKQINVNFDEMLAYTALLDDSYIYFSANENTATFYRSFFNDNTVLIGHVPYFYLSMKQSVLKYPYLYAFVSIYNNELGKIENNLVGLNLSDNTITQYESHDNSIAGVPTYSFNGDILTLKNVIDSTTITTLIESFDLENKEWNNMISYEFDTVTNNGTAILGMCSDDNNLYLLQDVCNGENNVDTFLKIYDVNYNEVDTIRIDDNIREYTTTSHITEMQVFDEYIYIYNASNYGFLGRVYESEFNEIFRGRNFELSLNHVSTDPLFYERRSNLIYTLDKENGNMIENTMIIGDGYSIMNILSTDEILLISCYADDKEYYAYIVKRENIGSIELPCNHT
jgi:hypothetical protein